MLSFINCFYISAALLAVICQVNAHECYVCKNQENNRDKCVETVKTCDISEDRCLTEVRWGSTPYWAPSGEKQYYVSKKCATKNLCDEAQANLTNRCDRIWYNDWECVECCTGDRCNYYVTLNANSIKISWVVYFLSFILLFHQRNAAKIN